MDNFGCVNNTIRVYSGTYFDFADPQPDQFTLLDLANSLARLPRFGGHITEGHYAVGEHLVLCAEQARLDGYPLECQRAVFAHDWTEGLCGDVVKPLKLLLPGYSQIEDRIEKVIARKYDIDFDRWRAVIKQIDHELLIAEKRALFPKDKVEWTGQQEVRALTVPFRWWTWDTVRHAFLRTAEELKFDVNC